MKTWSLVILTALGLARPVFAQKDVAAEAEALFREGKRLLEKKDFTNACPKLAESYRLDPATGALLALAVCHEGEGRTATAWAEFGEVAARSKAEGRADRERASREKSAALGPKLSTLTISLPAEVAATKGLSLKRDDVEIGQAVWGTPIPVDPGPHVVEATAAGKQSWRVTVTIGPLHDARVVEVPKLADELVATVPQQSAERPGAAPPVTPNEATTALSVKVSPDRTTGGGSNWRTAGIITAATGIAALAVGGYYISRTLSKKSEYESDPNCVYTCQALVDANSAGNIATGFVIGGTALVGAGAAMYLFGPRYENRRVSLRLAPILTADVWQLAATGRF
jgi:hypothetical protein